MKLSMAVTLGMTTLAYVVSSAAVLGPNPAFDISTSDKRSAEKQILDRRSGTILVFVCQGTNYGSTCQDLSTITQVCYNLGNGFKDSIESLKLNSENTCVFYQSINCNSDNHSGPTLPLTGPVKVPDTDVYGFKNNIGSYYCY